MSSAHTSTPTVVPSAILTLWMGLADAAREIMSSWAASKRILFIILYNYLTFTSVPGDSLISETIRCLDIFRGPFMKAGRL